MAQDARTEHESTDVLICGCGPTGALLSVLLSQQGVSSICLDKEPDIVTDPRGIALDEDGIRALQAAGILDSVYSEIGRCMAIFNFVGGVHSDLYHQPFMKMDYGTSEGGTGHVGFICHKQPVLEKHLRRRMQEEPLSSLRVSSELNAIKEEDDHVLATYTDVTSGRKHSVKAKFLVGADGKTGFVRKKYLEPRGIVMEQISQSGIYAETWVAMNLKITLPTPTTHPDFPLWKLGHTPDQVYDRFFPTNFRFLCNPSRPAVCGRFGLPQDRLWRFEYVVQDGEDGKEMASPDNVRKIVFPYLTHKGGFYGLDHDIAFPEDCIEILRSRPFFFAARSCNRWSDGRVVICGDAAHVFPPYGGQGIVSGFRDAMSLAWRLRLACKSLPDSYSTLFRGGYVERKQQLEKSLAATIENGRYVTEGNPLRILFRDTYLALVQMVPSWKRWLEQGARREGMCRYSHQLGLHFMDNSPGAGRLFPQVYCKSLDAASGLDAPVRFTDDVVFSMNRRGLFQIVAMVQNQQEIEDTLKELGGLDVQRISAGVCEGDEATIVVHDLKATTCDKTSSSGPGIVRIASAKEFAESPLCENRPKPRYYDPFRIAKEYPGQRFLVLRPDRFTFASCADVEELESALRQILPILKGRDS